MDFYEVIARRRSIRKFKKDKPVPRELIDKLLDAAIKSPSACNRQPWHFIVLDGAKKDELVQAFTEEVRRLRKAGEDTGSALATARAMAQAPVAVFVYDPLWRPGDDRGGRARIRYLTDSQSVGAAIQNLLLAATAEGLGSLWIGDTFVAEEIIGRLLHREDEMVAAVAIGWPSESPSARPRKTRAEVTQWGDQPDAD
ncbi:MAG: nitroreductase family protein [Bacillota bacterium]